MANAEQLQIVNFFREFDTHHAGANIQEIKEMFDDELTIWLMSRVEVFVMYNIYRQIRSFCDAFGITKGTDIILDSFCDSRLIMILVISALWPEVEYKDEYKQALKRWLAHRTGRSTSVNAAHVRISLRDPHSERGPRVEFERREKAYETMKRLESMGVSGEEKEDKLYLRMVACYRGDKGKFNESMDEEWSQVLVDYEDHAEGMDPTRKKKPKFISVMFKGDTTIFFKNEVRHLTSWPEIVSVLGERYNIYTRYRGIIE